MGERSFGRLRLNAPEIQSLSPPAPCVAARRLRNTLRMEGSMTDERADLLVGVRAIAEYLGYSRAAAQHLIDRGTMPVFRIGSRIHARRSTLNAWFVECEAKALRPAGAE